MWPFPPIRNEHIHISLRQGTVSCSLVSYENNRFYLNAHEQYELLCVSHELLFNTTELLHILKSFVSKHDLAHTYAHYILDKPYSDEQLVPHHKSSAKLHDLIKDDHKHIRYRHIYLGPHATETLFYVSGATEALLLQLQTVHHRLPIYLQSVSPAFAAQLALFTFLQHEKQAQAELIKQIDINTMRIPELFIPETYKDKVTWHNQPFNEDAVYAIASHIGATL